LKLVVEVDGEHHFGEEGIQHDRIRDQFLREQGYEVIRIPGFEVSKNPLAVRESIETAIDERTSL
jgi:very-short-patch-repair endonuclease